MASKRALITGANTGIGFEAALGLLKKDFEVVMACKDAGRAAAAMDKLRAAVPGAQVSSVQVDLGDLASVRQAASQLVSKADSFDVVLNNAGVMATPKMTTKDGFEFQLGINHFGHFLWTMSLLPMLQEGGRPVRIVNVASAAHQNGKLDFNDLNREKSYNPQEAYGQSKLANLLFTYELARRLKDQAPNITVNALHPGVVRTELGRYMMQDGWLMPAIIPVVQMLFKTPEQGAQTSIYLASSPEVAGVSGKYFVDCKEAKSSQASYDAEAARRLFDLSVELTKAPVMASARA